MNLFTLFIFNTEKCSINVTIEFISGLMDLTFFCGSDQVLDASLIFLQIEEIPSRSDLERFIGRR